MSDLSGPTIFVIGIAVGLLGGLVFLGIVGALAPSAAEHKCHFCGRALRPITVQCLDEINDPVLPEAKWYCADCELSFADRPAGKSAGGLEEV